MTQKSLGKKYFPVLDGETCSDGASQEPRASESQGRALGLCLQLENKQTRKQTKNLIILLATV